MSSLEKVQVLRRASREEKTARLRHMSEAGQDSEYRWGEMRAILCNSKAVHSTFSDVYSLFSSSFDLYLAV